MALHDPELRGKLALQRTGPYIPPITLPGIGNIVLTAEAKNLLDSSKLSGFTLAPVDKALIVELPWETWNLKAEDPPIFPESGEPEDYILGKSHSPDAARAMGELWEVVVPNTVEILRPRRVVNSHRELRIDLGTWNGADLIRGSGYGSVLFSERARDWFTEKLGKLCGVRRLPDDLTGVTRCLTSMRRLFAWALGLSAAAILQQLTAEVL